MSRAKLGGFPFPQPHEIRKTTPKNYGNGHKSSTKGGQQVSEARGTNHQRVKIVVERVYLGGKPMKQVFQQLAAEQVQKNRDKIAEQMRETV